MGGRGQGIGNKRTGVIIGRNGKARYVSPFGFNNVAEFGASLEGKGVRPTTSEIQKYLDTGKYDNYGRNNQAKAMVAKDILTDMRSRGFNIVLSETGYLQVMGDQSTTWSLSRKRGSDEWVVKPSKASQVYEAGGMKGALKNATILARNSKR